MKYEGPLYGKIGRRYLKLKQTSEDVDRLEYEHGVMARELTKRIGSFVLAPDMDPNRAITPLPLESQPRFNQLGPTITSFKIDQP
jgi:hypothetical protein